MYSAPSEIISNCEIIVCETPKLAGKIRENKFSNSLPVGKMKGKYITEKIDKFLLDERG